MYHFFIEQKPAGNEIVITGRDVNHIRNVLRMKPGEQIMVSCKNGPDYYSTIVSVEAEQVTASVDRVDEEGRELPSRIHLFQGIPKSDKMELIIQKTVELGVSEIIPVSMKRCVVKLDSKKEDSRRKRWENIAESAAKQSKRSLIPEIHPVMHYKEAVAYAASMDLMLIPYECAEGMEGTRKILEQVKPGMDIGIFIGPEGGFEKEEIELAVSSGGHPITLGKRILRTETAGLAILSVLMFQLEQ